MGERGPVPSRDTDLARPRSRKGASETAATKAEGLPSFVPDPDPDWHPIARMLWDSLPDSGQSRFYQQSDWAFAYSICDDISHFKRTKKRSGQMLTAIYSAMSSLLVTEGDRRRVRIELETDEDDTADTAVIAIEDYKRRLKVA
ncbi:phage terminase small subunit [Salininema proteolyticum]|uniref:Terminase small subunit n=1 Tax=Salininema proteolyticum TaxID=1607685 RepID=A0ABV8TTZ6_9ACTN